MDGMNLLASHIRCLNLNNSLLIKSFSTSCSKSMRLHYSTGFFCLLMLVSVHSWWETGHMLVAEIAKQELLANYPDIYQRAEEISLYVKGLTHNLSDTFIEAAVWLDDIKTEDWDSFYDWHFIDRPYNPLGLPTNPKEPFDAIYAIEQATKVLNNTKVLGKTSLTKSVFMRVLCHVVGDMHQPLHVAELYNLTYPLGDEGGNKEEVMVRALNQTMLLHSYWDAIAYQAPDNFKRPLNKSATKTLESLAKNITAEFPKSRLAQQLQSIDLNKWSIDIFLEAIEYAYKPLRKDMIIDQAYQDQAYPLMKKNLALAGYRLANLIRRAIEGEVQIMKLANLKPIKGSVNLRANLSA